ncbi:MAG: insulinase family protein [Candidatus Pacebacteria bacterium]|nr:insulinase family protein [Candidatus Paceibacterota bacterium]
MRLHTRKLDNGLTLQVVEMPGTNVVTALILAGAGSRYEDLSNAGIAHFLEHMFFKGGEKYKTPKEVSEAIDEVGGEFNAFTAKEVAGYYVKASKEHQKTALSVLSDMLLNARFPEEEIEKERGVILEEMAMYLDMPIYQVAWDFERVLFGDQPLGRDEIGTREVITSVKREDFLSFRNGLYVPENIVITLAGAVTQKDLDELERYFHFNDTTQTKHEPPFDHELATEKYAIREKQTEQYHINFGVRAVPRGDERFPTLKVLATILGGNMSSRMFQTIREEKGLCYSIHTQAEGFTDTGLLTTRAGVRLDQVLPAARAIREEYNRIAKDGISTAELKKARSYINGKLDLKTEDTEEVALHFAQKRLLDKEDGSFEQLKESVAAVTTEDVHMLAKELLKPEHYHFAGIGPRIDEEKLREILS